MSVEGSIFKPHHWKFPKSCIFYRCSNDSVNFFWYSEPKIINLIISICSTGTYWTPCMTFNHCVGLFRYQGFHKKWKRPKKGYKGQTKAIELTIPKIRNLFIWHVKFRYCWLSGLCLAFTTFFSEIDLNPWCLRKLKVIFEQCIIKNCHWTKILKIEHSL